MERIGVKMLGNFLWFIIGVISAFLGIAVFFISSGFITRFKQIYKREMKKRELYKKIRRFYD